MHNTHAIALHDVLHAFMNATFCVIIVACAMIVVMYVSNALMNIALNASRDDYITREHRERIERVRRRNNRV